MEQEESVAVKTGTVSFDSSLQPRRSRMLVGQRNGIFYSVDEDNSIDQTELPHSVHRQLLQSANKRNLGNGTFT